MFAPHPYGKNNDHIESLIRDPSTPIKKNNGKRQICLISKNITIYIAGFSRSSFSNLGTISFHYWVPFRLSEWPFIQFNSPAEQRRVCCRSNAKWPLTSFKRQHKNQVEITTPSTRLLRSSMRTTKYADKLQY